MIEYVIPGRLARSSRPGYAACGGKLVDRAIVDAWIVDVRAQGVRSIICLLADEHLKLYVDLGTDLPSYYRRQGLMFEHIPALDLRRPPLDAEALERIAQAYEALRKPVLVHCSAGVDRTGAAIAHLMMRFGGLRPSSASDRHRDASERK